MKAAFGVVAQDILTSWDRMGLVLFLFLSWWARLPLMQNCERLYDAAINLLVTSQGGWQWLRWEELPPLGSVTGFYHSYRGNFLLCPPFLKWSIWFYSKNYPQGLLRSGPLGFFYHELSPQCVMPIIQNKSIGTISRCDPSCSVRFFYVYYYGWCRINHLGPKVSDISWGAEWFLRKCHGPWFI